MAEAESAFQSELRAYDGRTTTLTAIEEKYGPKPWYLGALVAMASDADAKVSDGATWLLKSSLEKGATLSARQTAELVPILESITTWQAQLHLCQALRHIDIPPNYSSTVADWLSPLLHHTRPFVRAWAVSALCDLARQHADCKKSAHAAMDAALCDPAASVRARARSLQKTI